MDLLSLASFQSLVLLQQDAEQFQAVMPTSTKSSAALFSMFVLNASDMQRNKGP